jgi:hypothetical protein
MSSQIYSETDWQTDLEALGREFEAKGQADEQSVLCYTNGKYQNDAEERAHLILQALIFLAQHKDELEEAGIAVVGDKTNVAHQPLSEALYRWLVTIPWKSPAPSPNAAAILQMIREPWL